MSTPENQVPLNQSSAPQIPADVGALQSVLKTVIARLMAHSQVVQDLTKANLDLRSALHIAQSDKGQLEAYIQSLVSPGAPVAEEQPVEAQPEVAADANPVSA